MQSWTLSSGKSRESLKTPRMILKLERKSGESFPCSRKTTCWGNRWRGISENLVGRNMRKWKLVDLSCGANLPIIFYALFIFSLFIVFSTLYRCRYITNTTKFTAFPENHFVTFGRWKSLSEWKSKPLSTSGCSLPLTSSTFNYCGEWI